MKDDEMVAHYARANGGSPGVVRIGLLAERVGRSADTTMHPTNYRPTPAACERGLESHGSAARDRRRWLAVLVLVAMPVALVDPPVLMLLLDPELLALIVLSLCGEVARWRVPRARRGPRGTSREPV
jgi:hypothetical protein